MSMSSPAPSRSIATSAVLRDRLLTVADLLGVHPGGAVMMRLLGRSAAALRALATERPVAADRATADHLALLALFAAVVRSRLADPDPDVAAIRLAAWRTWLSTASLAGPSGFERPIDRLADPAGVADALADLVGDRRTAGAAGDRAGRTTVRLVSAVRRDDRTIQTR